MNISVQSNISEVMPKLAQFTSKQAPFAIAKALTSTAKLVQSEISGQLPSVFDRPNPFTRRAFAIKPANKATLEAFVFAKDKQARYLKFQVQGGGRRVKGFEKRFGGEVAGQRPSSLTLVPGKAIKRDQFGGVSLATIKRMSTEKNSSGKVGRYFIGKPKGGGSNAGMPIGIYARTNNNKKIQLQMAFVDTPHYRKRLDMVGIGSRVIRKSFNDQLIAAWAQAMRTAR